MDSHPLRQQAAAAIEECLVDLGLDVVRRDATYTVSLPGTRKLSTECALVLGRQALEVRAFVVRNPDENHAGVYRWLLERNLKLYAVAFSVDRLGDIHLTGRVPLTAITPEEVDRILGQIAQAADDSFNTLLELGFATSIRKEWQWRRDRGESTANLQAFRHLDPLSPRIQPDTGRGDGV